MRQYGQIQCAIWGHPEFGALSDNGKLLFLYLLTGEHSNGLGCYRIPFPYAQADLNWAFETVSKGFQELVENGHIKYCESTKFVYIPKYLKWNPISNQNTAKAREKEFTQIPTQIPYMQELARDALEYGNHFSKGFETVLERFANGSRRSSETSSKQQPITTQPITTQPNMSGKPDPVPRETLVSVLEYLNSKTGKKFQAVNTNLDLIRARLSEGYTEEDLIRVVDTRFEKWSKDPKMSEFLRPATLFGKTNFSQYAGEVPGPANDDDDVFRGAV